MRGEVQITLDGDRGERTFLVEYYYYPPGYPTWLDPAEPERIEIESVIEIVDDGDRPAFDWEEIERDNSEYINERIRDDVAFMIEGQEEARKERRIRT